MFLRITGCQMSRLGWISTNYKVMTSGTGNTSTGISIFQELGRFLKMVFTTKLPIIGPLQQPTNLTTRIL